MIHLDVLFRCFIWVLFVSLLRQCSQIHLDISMFICFSSFNLHLHLGGLINKMTKIYFLMFRLKIAFLLFWRKLFFAVFEEKCVFDEKMHFCGVDGKIRFYGFGGKYVFAVLAGKICFAGLAENVFLTKSAFLRISREKFFSRF